MAGEGQFGGGLSRDTILQGLLSPDPTADAISQTASAEPEPSAFDAFTDFLVRSGGAILDLGERAVDIFGNPLEDTETVPQAPGDDPRGPEGNRETGDTPNFDVAGFSFETVLIGLAILAIIALLLWNR